GYADTRAKSSRRCAQACLSTEVLFAVPVAVAVLLAPVLLLVPAVLLVGGFLPADFLAGGFLPGVVFVAAGFPVIGLFAVVFVAADFSAAGLLAVEVPRAVGFSTLGFFVAADFDDVAVTVAAEVAADVLAVFFRRRASAFAVVCRPISAPQVGVHGLGEQLSARVVVQELVHTRRRRSQQHGVPGFGQIRRRCDGGRGHGLAAALGHSGVDAQSRFDPDDLEIGAGGGDGLAEGRITGSDEHERSDSVPVVGQQGSEVGGLGQSAGDPHDLVEAGQGGVRGVRVRRLRVIDPADAIGLGHGDHAVGAE